MWAAGLFLFLLGIILIIVAPINMKKNARCSAETQGMLVDILERYDSKGRLPSMYVYSYRVNGTEYRMKSTIRSKQAQAVGDLCTIWYDPKKPKNSQPFHYGSSKIYKIILIIGIALFLLGFFLIGAGLSQ